MEYNLYVSNLDGYDPSRYDGTPEALVTQVTRWLHDRNPDQIRTPRQIEQLLPTFNAWMQNLRLQWNGEPPWRLVTQTATMIAAP